MNEEISVAVCIVTYNQEKYIQQAIDSALEQQSQYHIDIIVGDDCSTDKTSDIVRALAKEHKQIHYLRTETNQGVVANTYQVMKYIFSHGYTYTAMLDGDDYWMDPTKIQMEVEYLQAHPECSFVYTRTHTLTSDRLSSLAWGGAEGDVFHTQKIREMGLPNLTILHRTKLLEIIPWDKFIERNLLSCDYATNVCMASLGEVGFIDKFTAVYRREGNTVTTPKEKQKAKAIIRHQISLSKLLSETFPNAPIAETDEERRELELWMNYEWSLAFKDYQWLSRTIHEKDFPRKRLENRGERKFIGNKWSFTLYVYGLRKVRTLMRKLGI